MTHNWYSAVDNLRVNLRNKPAEPQALPPGESRSLFRGPVGLVNPHGREQLLGVGLRAVPLRQEGQELRRALPGVVDKALARKWLVEARSCSRPPTASTVGCIPTHEEIHHRVQD